MDDERIPLERRNAVVKRIDGDSIILLMECNDDGETMLVALDRRHWDDFPIIGQRILLTWSPQNLSMPPSVNPCVPTQYTPLPSLVELARQIWGINPGDKVLIVMGPNPREAEMLLKKIAVGFLELLRSIKTEGDFESYRKIVNKTALKNVGWGECLALTRLIPTLQCLDVSTIDIDYKLCETPANNFNPNEYKEHHLVFLGSVKSNQILSTHYWPNLPLLHKYEFHEASLHVSPRTTTIISDNLEFKTDEVVPDDALINPEKVKITDHFLLARVPNPFNPERNCILFSGTGTIGTGYAAVTAGGQQAIKILHSWFENRPFEIVGKVEMCGMFNPKSDPVTCVFRNGSV